MQVMNAGILGGLSIDKAYPMGSIFFGEGVNPNEAFPKTAWIRIGQGRVMVGVDEGDADYDAARKQGGAKAVALATANLPAHAHSFTGSAVNTDTVSHTHNILGGQFKTWSFEGVNSPRLHPSGTIWASGQVSTAAAHSHTLSTAGKGALGNAGGGGAHNNLQPFTVCEIWERIDGPVGKPPAAAGGKPMSAAFDKLYPAGALLYAMADLRPEARYGGTWERIRGRCVVFVDERDTDFGTALRTGGSRAMALAAGQIPGHNHTFTGSATAAVSAGAHTHSINGSQKGDNDSGLNFAASTAYAGMVNSVSHYHTVTFGGTIANAGSGAAHENRQPYLTCYMWYRAA